MSTFKNLLEKLAEAYKNQLPFVAYNKPNSNIINAVFQKDNRLHYVIDYSEEGFVFAPFDTEESAVLIPNEINTSVQFKILDDKLKNSKISQNEKVEDREKHIKFVQNSKQFLEGSDVSKVVVARSKEIVLEGFDVFETFEKLVCAYAQATCYVWFHPKVGLWMGATPETLLEIEGTSFKTMSLAGTQRFSNTTEVSWGEKELEEQQFVTDYVLSNLKSVTSSLKSSETYTVKAGALLHLRTDISGEIFNDNGVENLIKVLHPTPAVCGFPREKSKAFILENENFNRMFYTGFFGELNINKKSSLYVNLRCLEKIENNNIRLYVGGGITAKSDPEKEWEETVAKCRTMESIL